MASPLQVLVVDIGGSKVKALATGVEEWRRFPSGRTLTPRRMVEGVEEIIKDWNYDVVTVGYPGDVAFGTVVSDPPNLAPGWIGFDFRSAFKNRPTKLVNDAVLPAIGCYKGGRMLFLGLGTGLGAVMIVDGLPQVVALDHLPFRNGRRYGDYLAKRGLWNLGRSGWESYVHDAVRRLKRFFGAEYVALGGGNASQLRRIPRDAILVNQDAAFLGGLQLWDGRGGKWAVQSAYSRSVEVLDRVATAAAVAEAEARAAGVPGPSGRALPP